jgi:hypothetical protein
MATTLEEELSPPCLDDVVTTSVWQKKRHNFRTWSKRSSLKPLLLSSICGKTFEDCLANLDKVLKRCQIANLVLNKEKELSLGIKFQRKGSRWIGED